MTLIPLAQVDQPRPESAEELDLLKRLDRIFTDNPVYGSRRLQVALWREGVLVGRRRIRRLMQKLGLWALRPKRNTRKPHPAHKIYPYLLRGLTIDQPNQAWATDITDHVAQGVGRRTHLRLARQMPKARQDWKNYNRKALAFLRLASIRLMLRKLCNPAGCFRIDSQRSSNSSLHIMPCYT